MQRVQPRRRNFVSRSWLALVASVVLAPGLRAQLAADDYNPGAGWTLA